MRRFLLKIFIFSFLFYSVERFCHNQTEGFSILNIESNLTFDERWLVDDCPPNLEEIMNQRFYYLTKGAQVYVFTSQDGGYILKFFKLQHFHLPYFLSRISLPNFFANKVEKKLQQKKRQLDLDFASYKLAFECLHEETGLLFLHLNKTNDLKTSLTIVDKLGIEHKIDPNQFEFLLQKKAELVPEKINRLMKEKQTEVAKKALHSLISLIFYRIEKGIFDLDPNLSKNFGFLNEQAIEIDIGRFSLNKDVQACLSPVIQKSKEDFQHWLNKYHPQLSEYFHQEFEYHLQRLLSKNEPNINSTKLF